MKQIRFSDKFAQEQYEDVDEDFAFVSPMGNHIEIYLNGEIKSTGSYTRLINLIRSATPSDLVSIYICSSGGDPNTAIQFRDAIRNCPAAVIGCPQGQVFSAATMILLACDDFQVAEHTIAMIHNYSGFASGKGGELYDQVTFTRNWSSNIVQDIYKDFLSGEEMDQVLLGKDLWFDDKELSVRLKSLVEKRNEARSNASNKEDVVLEFDV